jgi:hypothetical protein
MGGLEELALGLCLLGVGNAKPEGIEGDGAGKGTDSVAAELIVLCACSIEDFDVARGKSLSVDRW